jgi:hypothetical protein
MSFCVFESNEGLLEGFCAHIVNKILFESDECFFKGCESSLIYFGGIPKSVRFGSNSLKGCGILISSRERIGVLVTGCLCFDGSHLSFEDNILFELIGIGFVQQNCSSLSELFDVDIDDDEHLNNSERGMHLIKEVKNHIVIDEESCMNKGECDSAQSGGTYCNCNFQERKEISVNLTLLNCTFQNLNCPNEIGGAIFISKTTFVALNTIWKNCSAETGGGVAICDSGSGTLKNCTFRECGIAGYLTASQNFCGGGALAMIDGGNCESESCYFELNIAGSCFINDSGGIFTKCNFLNNGGYCGGFYITGSSDSTLSLSECHFENNRGFSFVSHINVDTKCTFSASSCLFVWSPNTSILFHDNYTSVVNLSFDYFIGSGFHLSLPQTKGFINFTVHDLCFTNLKSVAISGFFPNDTNDLNIYYNCEDCVAGSSNATSTISASVVTALSPDSTSESPLSQSPLSQSSLSQSAPATEVLKGLTGWMIALIVVSGLILIMLVIVGFCIIFRRKLLDEVLPSDYLNPNIEMVSINRSSNTELAVSDESMNNNTSDGNSSSDFVFEPDLEEVQL